MTATVVPATPYSKLCTQYCNNVPDSSTVRKRADQISEWAKTCAQRLLHLLLLILLLLLTVQRYLVTMPSEIEGRISLALQAYNSH
jgi:hypothetical protein